MNILVPMNDGVTVSQAVADSNPKRVLLLFFHGVGDLVMFHPLYQALCRKHPGVTFKIGVAPGMSYESLYSPDIFDFVTGSDDPVIVNYDLVVDVQFPMSEGDPSITKGEKSAARELGIDSVGGYTPLKGFPNRLCGVHFHCTCLPGSAGVDEDTARKVVEDIRRAGWIPFDTHVEHTFHNPVNKGWDFLPSPMRKITPRIDTLVGAIERCGAFVGVSSGNWHLAASVLPPERVYYLERDFKACSYNRDYASNSVKMDDYNGEVYTWLTTLSS